MGDRARLAGLNLVGLERRGFQKDEIHALRAAYRLLFGNEGTFAERMEEVGRDMGQQTLVADVLTFARASRSLCQPREG